MYILIFSHIKAANEGATGDIDLSHSIRIRPQIQVCLQHRLVTRDSKRTIIHINRSAAGKNVKAVIL